MGAVVFTMNTAIQYYDLPILFYYFPYFILDVFKVSLKHLPISTFEKQWETRVKLCYKSSLFQFPSAKLNSKQTASEF